MVSRENLHVFLAPRLQMFSQSIGYRKLQPKPLSLEAEPNSALLSMRQKGNHSIEGGSRIWNAVWAGTLGMLEGHTPL